MSESTQTQAEPVAPIDYGRPGPEGGFFSKISGWFGERVNGLAEFIGMLIAMIGLTGNQLKLAFGFGCLAGGYGASMLGSHRGPFWMFVGAFLIGLAWPTFRRK